MTVHLFGAVSSPSCACYTLRKTAEDGKACFPADVINTVKQSFYVDDCLKSTSSEEEAVLLIKDLTALCLRGGFYLTKWVSNSRVVLQAVAEEHRAKDLKELDLDRDSLPLERALGLQWCIESDAFQFKMLMKEKPYTRRGMLSLLSSVYDPLGFIAPITLPGKVLLQELCRRNLVVDSTAPRGSWLLGKVLETFPDKNGFVRSARLKTKSSIMERPVTKLCLLMAACDD